MLDPRGQPPGPGRYRPLQDRLYFSPPPIFSRLDTSNRSLKPKANAITQIPVAFFTSTKPASRKNTPISAETAPMIGRIAVTVTFATCCGIAVVGDAFPNERSPLIHA